MANTQKKQKAKSMNNNLTDISLDALNQELLQYADGRVSVCFDPGFDGGTYYTYDDFSGAGRAVIGSLASALQRVKNLSDKEQGYAMFVEAALSS